MRLAQKPTYMHDIRMDQFDRKLLGCLSEDGALTNQQIADRIGLSPSQVSRRRQALADAGVILGYEVRLDRSALGLGVLAYIHATMATHSAGNARRFADLVRRLPEVLEAHALTGSADYILKVIVPDLKALARLINEELLPDASVERVRSEIVLDTLKESGSPPLPES
jgi:DNA-binding Lrp family transcriptional regulator